MSALSSILVVLSVGLASLLVGYLLGWSRGWMAALQAAQMVRVRHWCATARAGQTDRIPPDVLEWLRQHGHSAHVGKTGGGHADMPR